MPWSALLEALSCCRKETLSTLMLGCIKKGGVVEAALACRGIGATLDPVLLMCH